jgi:hypothetical protein
MKVSLYLQFCAGDLVLSLADVPYASSSQVVFSFVHSYQLVDGDIGPS